VQTIPAKCQPKDQATKHNLLKEKEVAHFFIFGSIFFLYPVSHLPATMLYFKGWDLNVQFNISDSDGSLLITF
jgi:hypothetical protein